MVLGVMARGYLDSKFEAAWVKQRELGKWRFIITNGTFFWGGLMFILFLVLDLRTPEHPGALMSFPWRVFLNAVICSSLGTGLFWFFWHNNCKRYGPPPGETSNDA
jgi:hypothetical protein